ncbi:MAG: ABC transporter permease subunit [Proteobacteria bacterium]|nr:ABC transporter permease subunit [Pseudomonadota bacterium]NIS72086.1 ABC transporter permease subunit [Pseudomonadota bacterium]
MWVGIFAVLLYVFNRFNLNFPFMLKYLPFIMKGVGYTILVSLLSIIAASILALFGAIARLSKNPVFYGVATFYVSLIRGTPLIVQIFVIYLGLPQMGIVLGAIPAGIIALGVCYGAYMTEIFRGGIQSIGRGQIEAAYSLGMTYSQMMRRVVLPQAFRIIIPATGNEFIAMLKDSSLVAFLGVWELFFRAQRVGRQNFRNMETLIIAALFYWIVTIIFQYFQGRLEAHLARGTRRITGIAH